MTTTNQYQEYNQTEEQQNGMIMAETIGYLLLILQEMWKLIELGYELIDNNTQLPELRNSEIIKKEEIRTSVNKAMINESTKRILFSQTTLPVKVLEIKVKEPIIDSNIKTLPLIYGRKSISYGNSSETNNYKTNNIYQSEQLNQVHSLGEQGNNEWGGNVVYSASL